MSEVRWNLARRGGWEKYKKLTEEKSYKIKAVIEDDSLDNEEVLRNVEKIDNKIKFQAFGKCTLKRKESPKSVVDKEGYNEAEKALELIEKQNQIIEAEVKKIKEAKIGKVGQIYKISKAIKGNQTNNAHAIKDPDTKKLIVDKEQIKKVSLNYCKRVLKKNDPEETMKKVAAARESLIKQKLEEDTTNGFEVDKV